VRYTAYWGCDNSVRIYGQAQLRDLLAFLRSVPGRGGAPYAVDLLPAGVPDGGLQLGIGHPERAFVLALDDGGAYAVQPHVAPWPEPIAFDCGNEVVDFKPSWTRVTPQDAIRAAYDYVRTGYRPAWLTFDANA
jgi:hypothetical protein